MSDTPANEAPKHPGGRPTKYDPAYCDAIVDFCREGYSLTAFAGEIGVARETLTKWGEAHPEFLLSLKAAKAGAALWWEKKGRRVAENGGGPGTATMITFTLKNFAADDYAEKVNHNIGNADDKPFRTEGNHVVRPDLGSLSLDQLRAIESILATPAEPD